MEKNKVKKITLYDGFILMVLIGIGASLFTPGAARAVEEKKLSDMVDRLQIIRSQIQLYRAEHNDLLPGQKFVGDTVSSDTFTAALKQQRPGRTKSYLKDMFTNPYVADLDKASAITCVNDANAVPTGREVTGWWFNAATGDFLACDSQFHTNY